MSGNISIITHRNHNRIAEQLGNILQKSKFDVYVGPNLCNGFGRYKNPQHFVQRAAACNVILMSRELFQEERSYAEIFAAALDSEWDNLCVISLDDQWPFIDHELIKKITKSSYINLKSDGGIDNVDGVSRAVMLSIDTRRDRKSHFNSEHFQSLLMEMFGECEEIEHVNNPSMGVNLSIFKCLHPSSGKPEIYVGIYPSATLESCKEYLSRNHPAHMVESATRYIVRSQPSSELSTRQSELTQALFGGTALRFETMVGNRRFQHPPRSESAEFDEIIIPQSWSMQRQVQNITIESDRMLSICKGEQNNFESRIIILSGSGGAGKTHFVRYLFNDLANVGRDVFFLTAESVRRAGPDISISNLYDIYLASANSKTFLSRDMFYLKFFVDEIFIVVDGLEEIITLIGDRFRISDFFTDCKERANMLANGKIIITSRDTAWPSEIESYADQYEINLFTGEQAKAYFAAEFTSDLERRTLAERIYRQMNESGATWPPLNCKLIAVEVQSTSELDQLRVRIDHKEFANISNIQTLLEGVIKRDHKHGVYWPLEATIEALGRLAAESVGGPVAVSVAIDFLSLAFGNSIPENFEIAVRNFVFFKYNKVSDTVAFRFEFVETTLLAKYIVTAIRQIDTPAIRTASGRELFGRRIVPGSDVSNKIIQSLREEIGDDFFDILDEMIRDLALGQSSDARETIYRQIVSNLLYIRLHMDGKLMDVGDYTGVLDAIFDNRGKSSSLSGISIIRFGQGIAKAVKFDLTGREIVSGWFEDSPIDRIIQADSQTKFVGCTFRRALSDRPVKRSGLWEAKYESDCWMDDGFQSALSEFGELNEITEERCEESLVRFFKLFAHGDGHAFIRRRKRDSLQGMLRFRVGFGVDDIFQACSDAGLMKEEEGKGETLLTLTKRGRNVARDLVLDAIVAAELRDVIRRLIR